MSVLRANTQPKKLTARGLPGYSPTIAVGNGKKDCPIRKIEFSHTKP